MIRKKNIITNNPEIYQKFSLLHIYPEVTINDTDWRKLSRFIDNINRENPILSADIVDNIITVKKLKPLNFNIYLKK